MKKEQELENNFIENIEDINLKHFIYLDRNRLHSYSSQLLNGIVQIKRLTENEANKITQGTDEEYTEEIQEDGKEGEISIGPKNLAGGLSGKTIDKTIIRKGFKKGINADTKEYSYSSSEDIVDHDNGYLDFEEGLIRKGILKEIKSELDLKEYSSLIKITGTSKFFDWNSIIETFTDKDILSIFLNQTQLNSNQRKAKEQEIKIALKMLKAFSLGSITIHTKIGDSNAIGSINPENLCMTREQLRTGYIMPGDVEVSIVGFVPRRKVEKIDYPGMAGTIDMIELLTAFVGRVDIAIDPIAIYTKIN
ncbi:MAG TPA: hypothetical protein VE944_12535 [Nostoc sp.]|uniref:DUF6414 family protein n=1 Tax=Nostoc sp. TaxID=1180 RepID=UPI002D3CE40A|nr:hypothetical protein [Nostoc sp.]HYX15170.1 hypothetical protein [Nostoc sp.]